LVLSSTALLLSDRYSCERPLTIDLGRIYDLCSVRLLLALLALMAPLELVLTLPFLVPDPVRLVALCAICSITFLGFGTRFISFP
jgi:hypothetical protein